MAAEIHQIPTALSMSIDINVNSEIGPLKTVVIHTPGQEIENMTPQTAAEVLYDDILNLELATGEHRQLKGVLERVCRTIELRDLLAEVLEDGRVCEALVQALCDLFDTPEVRDELLGLPAEDLARQLVEGTPKKPISLEKFLSPSRYAIPPLPNTFFTRDATMCVNDRIIIGSMAYRARMAEASGRGARIFTRGPIEAVSACHERASASWAVLVAP